MKKLFENLNSANYITFALILTVVFFIYHKHLAHFFSKIFSQKKIKGVKLKKKKLSHKEFIYLQEKINSLGVKVNDLNQSFILNNKLIDFNKTLKEINRDYLEIYLTIQRFKHEKIPDTFKLDVKKLEFFEKKLKNTKKIIDNLNLEQKIKTEDKHSNSLHLLSIIRMTFVPLAIIVTYFKMKFTSMGFDFGSKTEGIWTIKYGQTFLWTLMIIAALIIILAFHFEILA